MLVDITGFYFFSKTDEGQNITLPNSLVMQKGIKALEPISDSKVTLSAKTEEEMKNVTEKHDDDFSQKKHIKLLQKHLYRLTCTCIGTIDMQ